MVLRVAMLYVNTLPSFTMMLDHHAVHILGITKYFAGIIRSQELSMQVFMCVQMLLSYQDDAKSSCCAGTPLACLL